MARATAWWINRVEEKERTADLAIDVEHVHIVEGGIDLGTEAVRGRPQVGSVPRTSSPRLRPSVNRALGAPSCVASDRC